MKIGHVILEAISGPLYQLGRDQIERGLQYWIPQARELLDQYTDRAQFDYQIRRVDPNDAVALKSMRDQQFKREFRALIRDENPGLREHIVRSFKKSLEDSLREASINFLKDHFGNNLPRLQHLIVDIDFTATYKSGRARTAGGFFTPSPSYQKWSDQYSASVPDALGDKSMAIKVYTTEADIWEAAVSTLSNSLRIEHFGRLEKNSMLGVLLSQVLPTWAHETVHLRQNITRVIKKPVGAEMSDGEAYLAGQREKTADMGISYTPMYKSRPRYTVPHEDKVHVKSVKGGIRGHPSHLPNPEKNDSLELIEYYGTAHEIEAHAAGAAAQIVHQITSSGTDLNQGIDTWLKNISVGQYGNIGSLNAYAEYIRGQAHRLTRLKKWNDDRVLNKINIGARKAWTIFLRKVAKHLMSYKQQPGQIRR